MAPTQSTLSPRNRAQDDEQSTNALKFRDATQAAGLAEDADTWSTGVTMVDVNNDGHLDVFVCNYDSPNRMYLNQGDGTFTKPANTGLDVSDASLAASFADYDNDGDLDCYLLTNRYYRAKGRPKGAPAKMKNGVAVVLDEYKNFLSHQTRRRQAFFDRRIRPRRPLVSQQRRWHVRRSDRRIEDRRHRSRAIGICGGTIDDDGWVDIYVCNDFDDPDCLWRNNGDGTFSNVIAKAMPHTTWFSMGSDLADVNNDGLLDFFSVDMSATNHFRQKTTMGVMNNKRIEAVAGPPQQTMRNALLLNTGTNRFLEAAHLPA